MDSPNDRYRQIAQRHGVDLASVSPPSFADRIEALEKCLADKDVPFPIPQDKAQECLRAARSGQPFRIGMLSDQTVDLGVYTNAQHYDAYTFEENLSWACLIAEQQRTKHRYACGEYLHGEELFSIGGAVIPDFYLLNARIFQQTQWQLATVNQIIRVVFYLPLQTVLPSHDVYESLGSRLSSRARYRP